MMRMMMTKNRFCNFFLFVKNNMLKGKFLGFASGSGESGISRIQHAPQETWSEMISRLDVVLGDPRSVASMV